MSKSNATMPRVRLTVGSIEGNVGEYLSHEFLRTVNGVFDEMLSRLYHGAEKRKGWAAAEPWKEMTVNECRTCIRESIGNGKLIDAMNYIMFAYLNGHTLMNLRNPSPEEPVSVDSQMRDQLAAALGIAGRTWEEMLDTVSKWAKIAGNPVTSVSNSINLRITLTEEQQKQIAETLKRTRMQINNAIAKWPRMTPPESADESKKTALPNAIAAPYGVKASKKRQQYELTMEADDSGIPTPLFIFRNKKDRDDYLPLLRTFLGALEQAAYGKGRVRHANDLPFIEQPILTMAHMLNSDAGLAQQVIKKTVEARTLPTKSARISELRGTLVYAAAMILFEEMYGRADDPDELDGVF